MPIYTKTGDKGTTALFGGKRVLKSHAQISAYGAVDELSSFLGLLIVKLSNKKEVGLVTSIQHDLYEVMSILAGSDRPIEQLSQQIHIFEQTIDATEAKLPKLTQFILPQGGEISSLYHIVRTICRRAERDMVEYFHSIAIDIEMEVEVHEIRMTLMQYMNRLSDLFFILARKHAKEDVGTKGKLL